MPDYDADFYGWANEQAALLRAGPLNATDIAEEIECMGSPWPIETALNEEFYPE